MSTFTRVPNHYLNQCWLTSKGVLLEHFHKKCPTNLICNICLEITLWNYYHISPRAYELTSMELQACIVQFLVVRLESYKSLWILKIGVLGLEGCWNLTHWPLGNLDVILKPQYSILFYWLVSSDFLMTVPPDAYHRTLLMISQH